MKKAKIMLIGLTVLAAAGGTTAFRAKTFSNHQLYCDDWTGGCTIAVNGYIFEPIPGAETTTLPCKNVSGVPVLLSKWWSLSSESNGQCAYTGTVTLTDDAF